MADNIQNTTPNELPKVENKRRHFKKQHRRKKKILAKRKNNQYFKRKRLLRALVLHKNKLKMSKDSTSSSSDNRWQQVDEIAFWKARAISLEFENKMLHKHIKKVYMNMITYNQAYQNQTQETNENNVEFNEVLFEKEKKSIKKKDNKTNEDSEDEEQSQPPKGKFSEIKVKEMQKLYGSAWRKITGMETAVQLNYNLFVGKTKAKHWPVIPIVFERK